ncbi:hypothetical protein BsIDN1_13220 [Bacillus safensis]|uniref:FAD-dependent oxidoreductase 2 FAD-binding domain-containing protein n=1 Tax=Bacillus safensis TaxID=561879 RepID=A0A5S9M6B2_BACIA|nr:hypothetical protein BsIDN1_13220 [Bacillus safensis]
MLLDCAIIGGGPAGLSAALVVGRGRKQVIVFDNELPRNRVTQESHGFITNDGMTPFEIRQAGEADLQKYPHIQIKRSQIVDIQKERGKLYVTNTRGGCIRRKKKSFWQLDLQDILPEIEGIHDVYGKTLFSCPFCDGWELKEKALALIAENQRALHMAKLLSNWTKDLIVFTNGHMLAEEDKTLLTAHSIQVIDVPIVSIDHDNGQLRSLQLANGEIVNREGGFLSQVNSSSQPHLPKSLAVK